jgi:HAD superfamily hydrolase (TIGR01509 family)
MAIFLIDLAGVIVEMNWDLVKVQKYLKSNISSNILNQLYEGDTYVNFMLGNTTEEKVIEDFIKKNNLDYTINQIKEIIITKPKFVEGIKYILDELSKTNKLYCITNEGKEWINYKCSKLELSKYFKDIFSSSKLKCLKPSKEFFNKILNTLKVYNEEIILIDDNINICKAAVENGIKSICFINSDKLITDLKDLGFMHT